MPNNSTPHWRVKLGGGVALYAIALSAGAYEIWNNLLNAHDPQAKVVAVLAVVSAMALPGLLQLVDKGSAGRKALYAAVAMALVLTGWSGIKASLNSQGSHILNVSDTLKARSSSETNEATARADAKAAKEEAALARAEAAKIDIGAVAAAEVKIANARAAATGPQQAYANEMALVARAGITCEVRTPCTAARSKAATAASLVAAAESELAAAKTNEAARTDALARADRADAKADKANAWLATAQAKLDGTKTIENSGADTMIANFYGWEKDTVARYDGLAESLLRLALILALSMAATPASLLIGSALSSRGTPTAPASFTYREAEILPPARAETTAVVDRNGLRQLILNELQQRGPAASQTELARRIAHHFAKVVERVATTTLSDVLTSLEAEQVIEREQAGAAKIVKLAGWTPQRRTGTN